MAHIAMSTGWTLDYVGWHVDLPRLKSLTNYWRKYPPVHVLLKAYIGYKEPAMPVEQPEEATVAIEQNSAMDEFFQMVPQRPHQPPVVIHGNRSES